MIYPPYWPPSLFEDRDCQEPPPPPAGELYDPADVDWDDEDEPRQGLEIWEGENP